MYRGWTQIDYQNKHYNIDRKDEGTWDGRGRGGGTNFMLRIKEQDNTPNLQEHDDDDDDDDDFYLVPRLRMSGAIPLLPLYARMSLTGKTLPCIIRKT